MSPRLLLAGAALACFACNESAPKPPLVMLVSIDTLRADHLGFYGYSRPTSPVLDALALESTVFDEVMSTSPWTLPAHATMLTGLYPRRHGLTSHERYLASSQETLALLFSRAGYRTAAVVNSHNLGPDFGLDRGFQQYRYVEEKAERREPSQEITDQAIAWIEGAGDAPLFLFLHYYDVHSDYASLPEYEEAFRRPHEGVADGTTAQLLQFREGKVELDAAAEAPHLVDLYDAGIRQMDEEIGRLLSFLRDENLLERTFLVVTSDHGEEFFEHGSVLHGQTQYQEALRVPLLLRGPGIPKNLRVGAPVSLVDVLPTLLTTAGIAVPDGLDGTPLAPLWSEDEAGRKRLEDRYLYSEADHNNVAHDITRAVRYRSFKLHFNRLTGERRLYDLSHDPGERNDIGSKQKNAFAALSERLDGFLAQGQAEAPIRALSQEEIDRLRSLGYVR
ncbi:MAG: sulfatase [Vicinamibacteria bacterium]